MVRLGGYRAQHADTMDVLAAGQRVTLLVVPPETPAQTAHAALMAAGHRGNTNDVETLLRRTDRETEETESAQQRWELEGGPATVDV